MLIRCSITMQDLNVPQWNVRPLISYVMTKKINNNYYLCVKNIMFPHDKCFNLAMLNKIYHKFVAEGKMGLEFKEPKHLLSIDSKNKTEVNMLYTHIKAIVEGKKVNIATRQMPKSMSSTKAVVNHFDLMALEFVAVNRFDNRVLNMRHLTTLTLKKCDLPTIPIEIGRLKLKYLDISGSKLPINQDTFWNWTSMTVICDTLITLKMDSIGIKRLPFEIMFLKNLQTLSATKNKLSYLPQFIGELKKLKALFVADNFLRYLPRCFSAKIFDEMNISSNLIRGRVNQYNDHLFRYLAVSSTVKKDNVENTVTSLSHLALYNLMDNCIPFKRQDIPRTLWIYFNLMGRCKVCNKWILPDYCKISYKHSLPRAMRLIKDQDLHNIVLQLMSCSIPNNCKRRV
ncbi:leucine-rich repeat-containing protein 69-like [Rhopalosiphum maidis]|uniref:leucine-rich repeat-containing protein 69-like n=1 Tax=Rhopalosiphum maidis TaxID=43146 RepID=UPI000EFEDF74|nr:leucine-rich repeat-containing protein 69-like [Rhopalosiphum maidis]XP_026818419.1 leucine-rich repeat-containing protein 69-like [Rhopalosiphum maidis]XP_026818480.1 leucine-rich repeat-containing protein 69-like [Rhopalosiphum maidis]